MSARNTIVPFLALSTLSFLVACSSGGPTRPIPPPSGSFGPSNLSGTYVFSISGIDVNDFPYAIVGTFIADGKGGDNSITGGTIDINDSDTQEFTSGPIAGATVNNNGFYSVTADGRGQLTIGTNISGLGNLTFDFVLSTSSHGLISEFDTFGSGSGTIDLQASGVSPAGSYAFSFSGASYTGTSWATAGNFAYNGGSIDGLDDLNEGGILSYAGSTLTGSLVLGPSTTPATTLTFQSNGSTVFSGLFDVYAIDATHLKFIEMDETATLSGDAYSQTSPTLPASATTMAFTLNGELTSGLFAAGGFMTTNGSGGITGVEDFNAENGQQISSPSAPAVFTANYVAAGAGRYTLGSLNGFAGGTAYAAYPSSGGLLLLETDNSGISVGAAYQQSSTTFGATPQGYGLNLAGVNIGASNSVQAEIFVDDIAEFTASAATSGAGTLTNGIIDENVAPAGGSQFGAPFFDLALSSGTYGALDNAGRYGLSAAAGNNNNSTLNGGFTLTFYSVDGTTFPFIESDGGQVATGVFVLQNSADPSSAAAKPAMFVPRPLVRPHGALRKQK
jgi:hypothetical protein